MFIKLTTFQFDHKKMSMPVWLNSDNIVGFWSRDKPGDTGTYTQLELHGTFLKIGVCESPEEIIDKMWVIQRQ
jgi:hypothetical protein